MRVAWHDNPISTSCMDKHELEAQPVTGDMTAEQRLEQVQVLVGHWSRLSRKLVPLIGENGFVALFGRSVRLAAAGRVALSADASRKTSAMLLGGLEHDLARVDSATADAVHEELMSTFTRQLGALIGPGLTTRLLAETARGNAQEENQEEHK